MVRIPDLKFQKLFFRNLNILPGFPEESSFLKIFPKILLRKISILMGFFERIKLSFIFLFIRLFLVKDFLYLKKMNKKGKKCLFYSKEQLFFSLFYSTFSSKKISNFK